MKSKLIFFPDKIIVPFDYNSKETNKSKDVMSTFTLKGLK